MQKIIECFFFVFLAINSLAQSVLAIGEVGAEEAVEVVVYNDVFVVGCTYQQQLGNDVCKGNSDVFLQQYDVYGQLNWQLHTQQKNKDKCQSKSANNVYN